MVYTAGTAPSVSLAAGLSSGGPVYAVSGSSAPASPVGPLPLYTPPAVAETVRNPFVPPPLISEEVFSQDHGMDPVLTPAMQAINSLTDEYSEPMEFGMSPVLPRTLRLSDPLPSSSAASRSKQISEREPSSSLKRPHAEESGKESAAEMMEAKSLEDLRPKMDGEDIMVVEAGGDVKENIEMQVDKDEGIEEGPHASHITFQVADLQLLSDMFYLPFEHGTKGNGIVEEYSWLRDNAAVVRQARLSGESQVV